MVEVFKLILEVEVYCASILISDTQNSSSIPLTFLIIFVQVSWETFLNPLWSWLIKFFIVSFADISGFSVESGLIATVAYIV